MAKPESKPISPLPSLLEVAGDESLIDERGEVYAAEEEAEGLFGDDDVLHDVADKKIGPIPYTPTHTEIDEHAAATA